MRFLFLGDIVGRAGRDIVVQALPGLIKERSLDLVIANAENAAGGSGLTAGIYKDLIKAGVDGITLGDHVYRRREIIKILDEKENIVRPANLPEEAAGRRWTLITAKNGKRVAFCCLLGQLFMKPIDSPWKMIDKILEEIPSDVIIRFVDFHAEATSEMQVMGRHLDGKATAVLGTHTHVTTADEQILPGGTAFQCDVGMCGAHESIIGRKIQPVLHATFTGMPIQFDVAVENAKISGTLIEVDSETGKAIAIERISIDEQEAERLAI